MEPLWPVVLSVATGVISNYVFRWLGSATVPGPPGAPGAARAGASAEAATATPGGSATPATYGTLVAVPVAFFMSRSALTAVDLWYSLQGVRQQALAWLASPWLWLLLLVVTVFVASALIRRSCLKTGTARLLLVACVVAIAAIGAAFPSWQDWLRAELGRYVVAQAQELNERGEHSAARSRFMGILTSPDLPDALRDDVEGRIGQALFEQGKYPEAIEVYARMVETYPRSDLRDAAQTSIVWCISRMGKSMRPADAIPAIERLQAAHPRVAVIRPLHLAAGPELMSGIRQRPASPELHARDFLSARERAAITYLVDESKGERNRESRALGLFLLGRYDEVISTTRDGDTLSWALYHKADLAYAAGDLATADATFAKLLQRTPNAALADDAALRRGRCAEIRGDLPGALDAFESGLRLPDGDKRKELESRIALLVEVCDPSALRPLLAATAPDASRPRIEGLFRRLIALERFAEANAFLRRVDAARAVVPVRDVETGIALERAATGGEDPDAAVADLFVARPWVLYNSAWGQGRATYVYAMDTRRSVLGTGGVAPNGFAHGVNDFRTVMAREYFSEQNALQHAAARYRASLARSWDAEVALKCVAVEARLAYPASFVYDERARAAYRSAALRMYERLHADASVPMETKADAAEAVAQIGLKGPGPWEYERVIEDYERLVERYPRSHLANNALKRIGWCREELARAAKPGSKDFVANYEGAARAYRRILAQYPDGHVGREAKERLGEVEGVLYAWK